MISSLMVFLKILPDVLLLQDVATPLSLGSLCRFCIMVSPNVFSQTSILFGFLVQRYPWSTFSIISVWPSVLYDRIPYPMPLLSSGSFPLDLPPSFLGRPLMLLGRPSSLFARHSHWLPCIHDGHLFGHHFFMAGFHFSDELLMAGFYLGQQSFHNDQGPM
jgi:hypothetical protein